MAAAVAAVAAVAVEVDKLPREAGVVTASGVPGERQPAMDRL